MWHFCPFALLRRIYLHHSDQNVQWCLQLHGRLVITNPSSQHHAIMHHELSLLFTDIYSPPPQMAVLMEANSRDFEERNL